MSRKIKEDRLVLMTHNLGKLKEFSALLLPYKKEIISSKDLDIEDPEETGKTFEENAKLKALFAAKVSGLPSLADDSGLEVSALDGAPGIYSSRFANGDYQGAMKRINDLLADKEDRRANFTCVLSIAWPDGYSETFTGRVFGNLCWPPMGNNGFGYDPFFVPEGYKESFGILDTKIKERISHRSRAFSEFVKHCL